MAHKPESQFLNTVNRHLRSMSVYNEKMHNMWRGGTADMWYSGELADLWVEYKFIPRLPTRALIAPDLTPLQKRWLRARHEEGRNVRVIVGTKGGGVVFESPDAWEAEISTDEFIPMMLTQARLAAYIFNITGASPCLLRESSMAPLESPSLRTSWSSRPR